MIFLPRLSAICMKFWFWNMLVMACMYLEGSKAAPGAPGAGGGGAAPASRAFSPNISPNWDCRVLVTSWKVGSFAICSAICLIAGSCGGAA